MKLYLITFWVVIVCSPLISYAQINADNFNPPVNLTAGKYPIAIATDDLNGDGKKDIVVANEGDGTLSIFRNKNTPYVIADSSFTSKTDINTGTGTMPESIVLSDVDGDGKKDIIISYYNNKLVSVLKNNTVTNSTTFSFAAKVDIAIGFYTHSISLGDIDGDGKPDLVVANYDAGAVTIWKNTTSGSTIAFTIAANLYTGGNPSSVTIGNINGDSHNDLAIVIHDRGELDIFRNLITTNGGGINTASFAAPFILQTEYSPYSVKIADLNADSKPEILVTNIGGNSMVSIFQNTTTSTTALSFNPRVNFATGNHPYSLDVADLDGDSKPDLILANWFNTGLVSLLRNNWSSGTSLNGLSFTARVDLPTGSNPESVSTTDMDNDSKPDIVIANSYDGNVSVIKNFPSDALRPANLESTAHASLNSFVSTDLMDNEWKQEAPFGYQIAKDDGTTINASNSTSGILGRYAYFYATGTRTPLSYVQGNISFTAKGSGKIEVRVLSTYDLSVQLYTTFDLTSSFKDYTYSYNFFYPQAEYIICVIFNGGHASPGSSAQFKKNFCLTLKQCGLTPDFTRYRADSTSLIGNTEKDWYGWHDSSNVGSPRKKYIQHSAYSRMRFTTSATHIAIEYVRDFYDKNVNNLFPVAQTQNGVDWDPTTYRVNTVGQINSINTAIQVTGGKSYTIGGLLTNTPTYVWFNGNTPLGPPDTLKRISGSTAENPIYHLTAPSNATNLGLLVQRTTLGDTYVVYFNCMMVEGTLTSLPPFSLFAGYRPSHISGPAVFINGSLYKYYQVEGNDIAKQIQFVSDDLPSGNKTVEVMMPGQGTYDGFDPHVRRSGTYLRAVYFPGPPSATTVIQAAQADTNSITYIHDSILSGYNISSDAQNNVWMMKVFRDNSYGFKTKYGVTSEIFSEGYAGRILHTDTKTDTLRAHFAQKLASFKTNKYWFQIGVNDYSNFVRLDSFYVEYKNLVERLHTLRSGSKIFIQSIGPVNYEGPNAETVTDNGLDNTGPTIDDYRDVQRAIANGHSYIEYVNFKGLFNAHDINMTADGIHPTDAANAIYANGIRDSSSLLHTLSSPPSLALLKRSGRHMIDSVPGITTITAKGGKPPYTFTKLSGSIPSGVTFNADGTLTGMPSSGGTFPLSVKVTDALSSQITITDTLRVDTIPKIFVAPFNIAGAKKDSAYSISFRGLLGYANYKYAISNSNLPPTFHFNTDSAHLSGLPTDTGTYHFNITAHDHWNFSGSRAYTLHVTSGSPPPLTDNYALHLNYDGTNIYVTGELHDYHTTTLLGYFGVIVSQLNEFGTPVNRYYPCPTDPDGCGLFVNVEANHLKSNPVNFGPINPAYGTVTHIKVYWGSFNTTTLDGVLINPPAIIEYDVP